MESDPTPPSGLELAPGLRVPVDVVRFRFVRSSGPGGQNVNKVSTACELRIDLRDLMPHMTLGAIDRLRTALGSRLTAAGEIQLVSDEQRTQERNRESVLARLRELLIQARIEPKRRKKSKPSYGSKLRRLANKKARSEIKRGRGGKYE
ncbi:MAG: alternative ribosome rescue aminoacyl-tRNA hydrolase ArfB [Tepidisphaeraceae bacterium]